MTLNGPLEPRWVEIIIEFTEKHAHLTLTSNRRRWLRLDCEEILKAVDDPPPEPSDGGSPFPK